VLGENISQAAQFAVSGAAQAGIVASSLIREPGIAARGHAVLLPATNHAPLEQQMVILKGAGATAREFAAFVLKPKAQAIFARYGLEPPGRERASASPRAPG
jgi:molybdate transport system substrate-binding protein